MCVLEPDEEKNTRHLRHQDRATDLSSSEKSPHLFLSCGKSQRNSGNEKIERERERERASERERKRELR